MKEKIKIFCEIMLWVFFAVVIAFPIVIGGALITWGAVINLILGGF